MSTLLNRQSKAKRILLVEDDAAICYFLGIILRKAGYAVTMAADGASGLHLFRNQPWDLVITDRMMPQMNGEALAIAIKKESQTQPIVLITGFPMLVKQPELFEAIFSKPFSMTELLAGLTEVLARQVGIAPESA